MAEWIRALDWRLGGRGFESCCGNFASELWQFCLTPLCQCLSEETLKVVGPFFFFSAGQRFPSHRRTSGGV